MPEKIFISGIGTEVGKTVVSAVITEALQADYWKPVQAGNMEFSDSQTVRNLISNKKSVIHPEKYAMFLAASPHLAAKEEGIRMRVEDFEAPQTDNEILLIEGAGGLMAPLNNKETMIHLAKHLQAKVILVSINYLGSINHTLLSAYALQKEGVEVLGIIFNGRKHDPSEKIITKMTGIPVLGRVERMPEPTKELVAKEAEKFRSILKF
jgi:dethiobiotin synthetase